MHKTSLVVSLAVLIALGISVTASAQTTTPSGRSIKAPEEPGDTPGAADGPTGTGTAGGKVPSTQQTEKPGFLDGKWMFIMIGGFLLLWFWMGRGRKKEQRKRKEMLESLKKGDRVTSIGGIIGTVVDVRDDEVTVKVDESGNVRMHFARWAIRGVGDAAKAEKPEEAEKKEK